MASDRVVRRGRWPPGLNTPHRHGRSPRLSDHKTSDLERHLYLIQLLEHNETLFYRVVMADLARLLPITYDPTVGEAYLKFGHIFRRPRGLYLAITQR